MPPIQDEYNENIRPAVAGMLANMVSKDIISRNVENEAGIGFGVPVQRGTDDKGCVPYAGGSFLGITVRDQSIRPETPNAFGRYESARILTKGYIWVEVGAAVAAGAPVYLTGAGAFTSADTDNTAIPNAQFDTSTSGAGLAVVVLG